MYMLGENIQFGNNDTTLNNRLWVYDYSLLSSEKMSSSSKSYDYLYLIIHLLIQRYISWLCYNHMVLFVELTIILKRKEINFLVDIKWISDELRTIDFTCTLYDAIFILFYYAIRPIPVATRWKWDLIIVYIEGMLSYSLNISL